MISVQLSQEEWVMVIDLLAYHPYRKISSLMSNLEKQIMPQMKQMPLRNSDEETPGFTE